MNLYTAKKTRVIRIVIRLFGQHINRKQLHWKRFSFKNLFHAVSQILKTVNAQILQRRIEQQSSIRAPASLAKFKNKSLWK